MKLLLKFNLVLLVLFAAAIGATGALSWNLVQRHARDEVYFVTSQPERADWVTQESWSAKGDVGELRAATGRS